MAVQLPVFLPGARRPLAGHVFQTASVASSRSTTASRVLLARRSGRDQHVHHHVGKLFIRAGRAAGEILRLPGERPEMVA